MKQRNKKTKLAERRKKTVKYTKKREERSRII